MTFPDELADIKPNLVPIGPVILVDFLYFCIFDPLKHVFSEKTRWDQMEKMATCFFMFTILFRIF